MKENSDRETPVLVSLRDEMASWRDIEAHANPKADAVNVLRVVVSAINAKITQLAATPAAPPRVETERLMIGKGGPSVERPHPYTELCDFAGCQPVPASPAPTPGLATETEAKQAYGYLSRLFVHYAPQCKPLPDLLGVCSQIDNLLTELPGLRSAAQIQPSPGQTQDLDAWIAWRDAGKGRGLAQDGARETEEQRITVDAYAAAARVIGLHLREFRDESLTYDQMIAECARRAAAELTRLQSALASLEQEKDHLCAELSKRDTDVNECAGWLEQARTALAQVTQARDEAHAARLTEVEHWVKRYNELEAWRVQTRQQLEHAESRTWDAAEQVVQQVAAAFGYRLSEGGICSAILNKLRAARTPTPTDTP